MKFFKLFFGKKAEQPAEEQSCFEEQMTAIRVGKRLHPAMMTAKERHEETAKAAKKLKWSRWVLDPWGARAGFEAVRDRPRRRGRAVAFLSIPTLEEREELREIVREEINLAAKGKQMDQETYAALMERTNKRKRALEFEADVDEFEAQCCATESICGQLSLTVAQRIDLKLNFFI